jgi:ATP-dependent helicase HrpB
VTDLPVESSVDAVREALAPGRRGGRGGRGGRAILQAPPGAGKTTIVPLRLLDTLAGERILVLEPRRLATRAAASRMAFLLGEPVGETVGYTTRDERHVSPRTRVEVVTEGVLTRRLQHDRSLPGVGLVVFDEVHERNLHTDVAMALTLDMIGAGIRPDLRLLAMSATLDTERLAALLGDPVVIRSEGRQHPVDVRWAPPPPKQRLAEATAVAVSRALREQEGDLLVFLPGAGDIRRVEGLLAGVLPPGVDVRPLFGALSLAEQDLALAGSPPGRRRVVLSTDIAETSLTVEGVTTVVDSGQVRVPRYDARTGLTKLQTVATSRASADQRAGRAGRTGPGVAYRLWSKIEHAARRPFPDPEILSVDLAGVVLEVAVWGSDVSKLSFVDPPPARAIQEARSLLRMLGALDADGRPTAEGRAMAELPLHPRLARMVTGGGGATACMLAALLEERDVLRGRPEELPVDVAERLRLIADRGARHPAGDGAAVAGARRRADLLARRTGIDMDDVHEPGPVLALAYPDRVAQARGGARFRLRNGSGAWAPKGDPMATEAFLVVAELDADRGGRDSRIRIAAALAAEDAPEFPADAPAKPPRPEKAAPAAARRPPVTVGLDNGRKLRVRYDGDQPVASVRVQDLFGTARHPTVAEVDEDGVASVPVQLHLLSPANRVVQITSDLPGFWAGSYASVRKEMAGRYPKHPWPEDPATAPPPSGPRR